jgi:DNA modification methylase
MAVKNKFNRLTSKEWLPFQKSWFRFKGIDYLYNENIRFFCKAESDQEPVFYFGKQEQAFRSQAEINGEQVETSLDAADNIQFALIDLLETITPATSLDNYFTIKQQVLDLVSELFSKMQERRFLAILIPNIQAGDAYYPFAWDLAKTIATVFSLKDEKIACLEDQEDEAINSAVLGFQPQKETFYCLYFRKDEHSPNAPKLIQAGLFQRNKQEQTELKFKHDVPAWFILKPQPRKKNEVLHPAKYPEDLVEMLVKTFTQEGENVFDPMSGTGSTQMAALKEGRNGYGTELSEFFADIANNRCSEYNDPTQSALFNGVRNNDFKVLHKDARLIAPADFPELDYIVTSPPYWDMLNMKGAENQAKRKEKGLKTNYSDDLDDLGNIADYNKFIAELCDVYFNLVQFLKPGGYMTIVVKNIKKQGRSYPFAWDLGRELQKELNLLPEVFWCQDDISIAPYGYGNTWVSNTFHQYCLTFQKPLNKQ